MIENIPNPMEKRPVDTLNKPGKSCNRKAVRQTHSTAISDEGKTNN